MLVPSPERREASSCRLPVSSGHPLARVLQLGLRTLSLAGCCALFQGRSCRSPCREQQQERIPNFTLSTLPADPTADPDTESGSRAGPTCLLGAFKAVPAQTGLEVGTHLTVWL